MLRPEPGLLPAIVNTYNRVMVDFHSATPTDSRPEAPLTALVVEDDDSIAALLCFILERDGLRVEHAADGREAERLIAAIAPPAVVLLDIMLPYVDGFELIDSIRSLSGWQKVTILMLSTKGNERDIDSALDNGADDYLVKPFQPEELKARLRRLLRQRP